MATPLRLISVLPIATDPETSGKAWHDILSIARTERLTTYDAAYLELAIRRGAVLLTRDELLADAARRRGVAVRP